MRHVYAPSILTLASLLLGCSSSDGSDDPPAFSAPPGNGGPGPAPAPVTALFVLGDSLSDVGNAAGLADFVLNLTIVPPTVGLCNPADVLVIPRACDDLFYRQSRVSDGPVAVERLAVSLGLAELAPSFHVIPSRPSVGTNYAVASAKARGSEIEDLGEQVDRLIIDHAPLSADELYVVMIGGNDAIDALQATAVGGPAAAQTSAAIVTSAIAALGASVERLLDFGARRIVVANVPDLATLPAVAARARTSASPAEVLAAAQSISTAFDSELSVLLDGIANRPQWTPAPLIVRFDLRAALAAAQQSAAARGHNTSDACFDSELYGQSSSAERVFHPACAPLGGNPPRFGEFVFWDGIHPTGAAHAALGAALSERVAAALAGSG